VANASGVARALKGRTINSLRDLVDPAQALFATFPSLDHYGKRKGVTYIGPLLGRLPTTRATWPDRADVPSLFVCVRPDTEYVSLILSALRLIDASVVCVAPGFREDQLARYLASHVNIYVQPIDLDAIMGRADIYISYVPEGTVATCLLHGVPGLVAPSQVESHMAARRLERLKVVQVLRGEQSDGSIAAAVSSLFDNCMLHSNAAEFGRKHEGLARMSTNLAVLAAEDAAKCLDLKRLVS
jgi:UDP:flavonoid glycosyltransferase YjiC (YdhE family)